MTLLQAVDRRRQKAAALLSSQKLRILFVAGQPIGIPGGQDQVYSFVPDPLYYWLTGSRRPGGVLAYDPEGWVDFRVPVSRAEQVWEGATPQHEGVDIAGLEAWLERSSGLPLAVIGPGASWPADLELSREIEEQLHHLRRPKDAWEVALIEQAVAATARAFLQLPQWIRAGASEREVGTRLEAEMFLAGAEKTGYGTIVGAGSNSAILHWPPTSRILRQGEVVLVDAGGEISGYTADVTRVFAVGEWSSRHADLHRILLDAQVQAIERCQVGVEWSAIHIETAQRLAEGLQDLGLLRVDPQEAVESEAIAMFFPHGLGHMLGLGVRDASGLAPGRKGPPIYAGSRLRLDLPLQEDYLVTVEPGLYFIPALLRDPELRERHRQRVDWDALEPWMELGGMRIEDDILVTASGPRNLTAGIPK